MIIRPRPLLFLIIISFSLMCVLVGGACKPLSACGIVFWGAFAVFAYCCNHLSKNKNYYDGYDE